MASLSWQAILSPHKGLVVRKGLGLVVREGLGQLVVRKGPAPGRHIFCLAAPCHAWGLAAWARGIHLSRAPRGGRLSAHRATALVPPLLTKRLSSTDCSAPDKMPPCTQVVATVDWSPPATSDAASGFSTEQMLTLRKGDVLSVTSAVGGGAYWLEGEISGSKESGRFPRHTVRAVNSEALELALSRKQQIGERHGARKNWFELAGVPCHDPGYIVRKLFIPDLWHSPGMKYCMQRSRFVLAIFEIATQLFHPG
eukprot:SAG11_NODE_1927_length_4054_cov_4.221492_3_plen_254_part_00